MEFDLRRPPFPAEGFLFWSSVALVVTALIVLIWVAAQFVSRRSTRSDRRAWLIAFVLGVIVGLAIAAAEGRVFGADVYMLIFLLVWIGLGGLLGSLTLLLRRDPERRRLGRLSFQSVGLTIMGFWSSLLAYTRWSGGY